MSILEQTYQMYWENGDSLNSFKHYETYFNSTKTYSYQEIEQIRSERLAYRRCIYSRYEIESKSFQDHLLIYFLLF